MTDKDFNELIEKLDNEHEKNIIELQKEIAWLQQENKTTKEENKKLKKLLTNV
jgi:regulator of replication initiation timing